MIYNIDGNLSYSNGAISAFEDTLDEQIKINTQLINDYLLSCIDSLD